MRQLRFLCLVLLVALGCNKEIDEVLLPPFTVFPNPCQGFCQIMLIPGIPIAGDATLYAPNGDEVSRLTLDPGNAYTVELMEEGAYVLVVRLDGDDYSGQILNTRP